MMAPERTIDKPTDADKQSAEKTDELQDTNNGFAGELKNIQLENLIQLYCFSVETIAIKIHRGDFVGTVYMEDGEVVHAQSGSQSGEDAFYAIMSLQGGRIETCQTEKAGKHTIEKDSQYLLMEAARIKDENSEMAEDEEADAFDLDSGDGALIVEEEKLKALIVDDSKFMRKIIANMLTAEGDIEVVGIADNGKEAMKLLEKLQPDFITLDANMPIMDGPTTLKHIMIKAPCPVIIMSNLSSSDQNSLPHFFNLGAVDFLPKPVKNKNMLVQQQQILSRARSAAKARVLNFKRYSPLDMPDSKNEVAEKSEHKSLVVFISGPGGYHEMLHILSDLPGGPNTYFVAFQSLPEELTASFSNAAGKIARLNTVSVNSETSLEPGCCYIASSESHVLFQKNDNGYCMSPNATSYSRTGKLKNLDDFFASTIENFAGSVHAVFLSGAEGIAASSLDAIRAKNGQIIVQNPSSCMMPDFLEELISEGIADKSVSPEHIVREVLTLV